MDWWIWLALVVVVCVALAGWCLVWIGGAGGSAGRC